LERQLVDQNGGFPEAELELAFGGESTDVICVFGIDMGADVCELWWVAEVFEGRIPAGFVAIADDSGGNRFLLDVADDDAGLVLGPRGGGVCASADRSNARGIRKGARGCDLSGLTSIWCRRRP
jgi:hypothetical protein